MPYLRIVEYVKDLVKNKVMKDIPIICCSVYNGEQIIKNSFDKGILDFIYKPYSLKQVKNLIE